MKYRHHINILCKFPLRIKFKNGSNFLLRIKLTKLMKEITINAKSKFLEI